MMIVPNWCENKLIVSGAKTTLKKFDRAFKGRYALFPPQEFDKHGLNNAEIFDLELQEKKAWENAKKRYCFNALYPIPKEVLKVGYSVGIGANHEKNGVPDGYDWCIQYWGTKWDIYTTDDDVWFSKGETEVEYHFDTAWSPPGPWVEKVAKDFKTLRFELCYVEPGVGFAGELCFYKGEMIKDDYASDNWADFVKEKFGYDPCEGWDDDEGE
jgi:hypothetical protein